ncbi:MAG: nuclear transport factor 2 family protein, partial [Actinomycetia bacterium]|nr:nuclear transport factor 2 family protein [Actinomycetes bacterium]
MVRPRHRQTDLVIEIGEVIELETAVWFALQRGDAEADTESLSEDFLGVYPTGFADRADHVGQLADGPTVAEFALLDPRLIVLSDTDVLLSYRAEFRRPGPGSQREIMFVSSLWSQRDGGWMNLFSQDTPAVS